MSARIRRALRAALLLWMIGVMLTQWVLHGPGQKWVERHTGLPIASVRERLTAVLSPPLGS